MRLTMIAVGVLSSIALGQAKPNADAEKAAEVSAEAWLKLVDAGKYTESWAEASSVFKAAVSVDDWKAKIGDVRNPPAPAGPGKLLSRKVRSKTYAEKLPGAPDGKYVVILYDAKYERKGDALETITPMLDKDGKWRVSGYYIK